MKASEEWTNWKQQQEQRVNNILHFELHDKIRLIRDRWADLQIETTVPPMGEHNWDSMRIEIHTSNLEKVENLKAELCILEEMLSVLNLHFTVSMPKKEDNYASYLEVCQALQEKIKICASGVRMLLRAIGAYAHRRAHISQHILQNMTVQDFKNGIQELDVTMALNTARWMVDLEHLQVVLFDIMQKNIVDLYALGIIQPPGDHRIAGADHFNYYK